MDQNKTGGEWYHMQGGTVQIAVIYMASGFGKRFGGNKLLEMIEGKPLFAYGLELFAGWADDTQKANSPIRLNVILVSQYQEVLAAGRNLGVRCVENRQAGEGITASIRLGLEAAGDADFYLFSVADQPWLKQSTVKRFIREYLEVSGQYSIGCLSAEKGGGGNPVIFSGRYRRELSALRGDKGGSQIMKKYPDEVFRVWAGENEVKDIDRISDL